MADRIKTYQQAGDEITILKSIRTDLGVTPSSYTPDTSVVTKDRVVTFAQAEEELSVLGDIGAGVKQQVVELDMAQKDIKNIKALLNGTLYDYSTDNDEKYTKTVPSGAMPYASLDLLGGKTVVFNQLMNENVAEHTSRGITYSCTDNVIRATGTVSTTYEGAYLDVFSKLNPFIVGHKYYINIVKNDTNNVGGAGLYFVIGGGTYKEPETTQSFIYDNVTSSGSIRARFRTNQTTIDLGYTYNTTAYINAFDMTLMFGAGNEPTTVAEFEALFPASYYAYNAGTLLSAGVTGVESVGKNIWTSDDLALESGSGIDKIGTNEITVANASYQEDKNLFPINGNAGEQYTISFKSTTVSITSTAHCAVRFRYSDGTVAGTNIDLTSVGYTQNITLTSNSAKTVTGVSFGWWANSGKVDLTNIQLEKSATKTNYSPYTKRIFSIPAAVQALEGYGWSAGSVYNEIDFERKVFIQRVGSYIFDGTETWFANANGSLYTEALGNSPQYANGVYPVCDKFVGVASGSTAAHTSENGVCWLMNNSTYPYFLVRDSNYDGNTIASAMTGVTVYYPLATPIETDISAYFHTSRFPRVRR